MNNAIKWDYTKLAPYYDKRAEYSEEAILEALKNIEADNMKLVVDVGAGTGKLTKILTKHLSHIHAIEPNDEMRKFGKINTSHTSVEWFKGTGEETGLADESTHIAFFGSSFNVTDRSKTLKEVARILVPKGWFVCMWNHRDLSNSIQKDVEEIIKSFIPNYSYGNRREDQMKIINDSGLFYDANYIERRFTVQMSKEDYMEAWKSHGTLQRQSGDLFGDIISSIDNILVDFDTLEIPYFTRIYYAQLKK